MEEKHGLISRLLFKFRAFIIDHKDFFETIFLLLYGIEQALLFYFISIKDYDPQKVVGYFIIALLTTFGLHKIIIEIRATYFEKEVSYLEKDKDVLIEENVNIYQAFKEEKKKNIKKRKK